MNMRRYVRFDTIYRIISPHNFLNFYPLAMKIGTNVVFITSNNVTSLRSALDGDVSNILGDFVPNYFYRFLPKIAICFTEVQ